VTTAQIQLPPKLVDTFLGPADFRGAYGGRGSAKSRSFAKMAAVLVIPTVNPSGSGSLAVPTVTAKGTTGFDTSFSLDDASGNTSIINPVTFDWVAFGTVAGS
jgi:hypothetical protein